MNKKFLIIVLSILLFIVGSASVLGQDVDVIEEPEFSIYLDYFAFLDLNGDDWYNANEEVYANKGYRCIVTIPNGTEVANVFNKTDEDGMIDMSIRLPAFDDYSIICTIEEDGYAGDVFLQDTNSGIEFYEGNIPVDLYGGPVPTATPSVYYQTAISFNVFVDNMLVGEGVVFECTLKNTGNDTVIDRQFITSNEHSAFAYEAVFSAFNWSLYCNTHDERYISDGIGINRSGTYYGELDIYMQHSGLHPTPTPAPIPTVTPTPQSYADITFYVVLDTFALTDIVEFECTAKDRATDEVIDRQFITTNAGSFVYSKGLYAQDWSLYCNTHDNRYISNGIGLERSGSYTSGRQIYMFTSSKYYLPNIYYAQ